MRGVPAHAPATLIVYSCVDALTPRPPCARALALAAESTMGGEGSGSNGEE
jgi:hypothetical protein